MDTPVQSAPDGTQAFDSGAGTWLLILENALLAGDYELAQRSHDRLRGLGVDVRQRPCAECLSQVAGDRDR